jgi:hypothetical protein
LYRLDDPPDDRETIALPKTSTPPPGNPKKMRLIRNVGTDRVIDSLRESLGMNTSFGVNQGKNHYSFPTHPGHPA